MDSKDSADHLRDPGGSDPALPRSAWLLPRLREAIWVRHYSLRTEQAYAGWVRRLVHFHGLRHPRELGVAEVAALLTHLASERSVSASTRFAIPPTSPHCWPGVNPASAGPTCPWPQPAAAIAACAARTSTLTCSVSSALSATNSGEVSTE